MAKDLLLEIGTEEMPAGFVEKARQDMKDLAEDVFTNNRIDFKECTVYSTPRRLTLNIKELSEKQKDKEESVRGPGTGIAFDNDNPTKAALGFAKGQGLSVEDLVIKDGYLYAEKMLKGKNTKKLLQEMIPQLINTMNFPKSMRWGSKKMRFIRPIRWIVLLYGTDIVEIEIADVSSGRRSFGHRFLAKEPVDIKKPVDYFKALEKKHVIVDQQKRKDMIIEQIEELDINGGKPLLDEELVEEVVELVEYPTAFYGSFDKKFLKLPKEVLITSMIEHQRYFPVIDGDQNLLPYFIGVRNGDKESIDEVRHGNEMVLRARLADARFFYEEDLKTSPEQRKEKLKEIVYQDSLGSMYNKVKRIKELSKIISSRLDLAEQKRKDIVRAAELSKNDLVTEMVNEFSKLQGVMGREYALLNDEKPEVSKAIYEQYLPRYSNDKLPESIYGVVLSISDKIDNICSMFSVELIPTGSQDPFALRRQAAGVVKIILKNELPLNISDLVDWSLQVLNIKNKKELHSKIKEFLLKRVNNILEDKNIRYDIINAVINAGDDNINDIFARAEAVMELREKNTDLFVALFRGLLRAKNLGEKANTDLSIKTELLKKAEEENLYKSYLSLKSKINDEFKEENYKKGLKMLVDIKEPVDKFLDNVIVMVDDTSIKENRLLLLNNISSLVNSVMDIDEITLD